MTSQKSAPPSCPTHCGAAGGRSASIGFFAVSVLQGLGRPRGIWETEEGLEPLPTASRSDRFQHGIGNSPKWSWKLNPFAFLEGKFGKYALVQAGDRSSSQRRERGMEFLTREDFAKLGKGSGGRSRAERFFSEEPTVHLSPTLAEPCLS